MKPFGVPTPQTVTLSIVEDPVLELVLQLRQEQWLSRSRNAWNNGCSSILYYSVFQYLVPGSVSGILLDVHLNTEIVLYSSPQYRRIVGYRGLVDLVERGQARRWKQM